MNKTIAKRYFRMVFFIFWALCALVLIVASLLLSKALTPREVTDKKYEEAYTFLYSNYPHLESWMDSLTQHDALKEVNRLNSKKENQHAYYILAPEPTTKTALLVHGHTDSAERMFMYAYMYNKEFGYNVFIPDLPYHGKSEGEAIQMGWRDRLEVKEWIGEAIKVFGADTQIVIHGISMGAATSMMLSGEEQNPAVKAYIADCGYTSVWDMFAYMLTESYSLPTFPILNTADVICRLRYKWGLGEASALKQVEKSNLPMFFIHGEDDDYVPTYMAQELYDAKKGTKELWIAPNSDHATAYKNNREEYTRRVKLFVSQFLVD